MSRSTESTGNDSSTAPPSGSTASCRSNRRTSWPARWKASAAASPPGPAPMIATRRRGTGLDA
jgi:hypothetical protein